MTAQLSKDKRWRTGAGKGTSYRASRHLPMRFDEKRLQFCGRALGEFRTANREGQQRQVFVFPRERIVPNVPKMAN